HNIIHAYYLQHITNTTWVSDVGSKPTIKIRLTCHIPPASTSAATVSGQWSVYRRLRANAVVAAFT
ncbi:unnamed protein product, partial [Ceratitis capitata]